MSAIRRVGAPVRFYNESLWLWARLSPGRQLSRPRQRAVNHGDRVRHAVDGDEGAEARAFLLAEQDLVEHVEPVQRDAGTAVLALFHGIEERLAAADFIDH